MILILIIIGICLACAIVCGAVVFLLPTLEVLSYELSDIVQNKIDQRKEKNDK